MVAFPAVALNEAIFPMPDDGNPIAEFELVQLIEPAGLAVKFIAGTADPAHKEILFKELELGVVLTVKLKFIGKPEQPL
jgi:hypothetical protein